MAFVRNERNLRSSRRTRREPYQFSAWIDRMVLKEAGKWFSGRVQEQRLMSALDQLLGLLKKRFIRSFQELYVNNFPEKRVVSGNGKDRN